MKKRYAEVGFSLIEMAIVLFIVALLLGGLLPTVSSQIEQKHRSETQKQMDEIRSTLLGFAVSNGRLPCPDTNNDGNEDFAAPTVTDNLPQAGQSTRKTTCSASSGSLPYNQLGVSSIDAFGGSFAYAITPAFGEKNEIFNALAAGGTLLYTTSFTLNTASTLKVCSYTDNAATTPCPNTTTPRLTDNAVAVLVSRGPNWGGVPSVEETENIDNDTDFVSHNNSPTFDDLVIWLSPNALFNRMVAAGKLP